MNEIHIDFHKLLQNRLHIDDFKINSGALK
jgi:hypothetical protein